MSSNTVIRLNDVKAVTGLSKSTIYLAAKRGEFPSPISLGARAVGWLASDIDQWIASRERCHFAGKAKEICH